MWNPFIKIEQKNFLDLYNTCLIESVDIKLERDVDGNILSPNGKISEINNEILCRVIRTPTFLKWFGNWMNLHIDTNEECSKVIYENTFEPRIVFHSTNRVIPSNLGLTVGVKNLSGKSSGLMYFGKSEKLSKNYGKIQYSCFLNIRKPFITDNIFELPNSRKEIDKKFSNYDGFIFEDNYFEGLRSQNRYSTLVNLRNSIYSNTQYVISVTGQRMHLPSLLKNNPNKN